MFRKWIVWSGVLIFGLISAVVSAAGPDTSPQSPALSLETCLKMAYDTSSDLKIATQNTNVAIESVHQAQGGFWPSLNYQIGYTQSGYPSDNNYNGNLTLNLPIFTWGKSSNSLKVAVLNYNVAQETERKTKQTLTYNVTTAFYNLWLARQKLKVARASYNNLEQHYQEVEKFYKVGSKSKYELLQAEVEWKNQQPQVVAAENQMSTAAINLATLIGADKDRELQIDYDFSSLKIPDQIQLEKKSLLEEADLKRPEIRQANLTVEVAKLNAAIAKTGNKPTLAVSGSYQGQGSEPSPEDWDPSYRVTLSVNGLLFDGNVTGSKIKAAEENVKIVTTKVTQTRDQIQQDVYQTLKDLQNSLETIKANQATLELSRQSLKMCQEKYTAGLATTMDVKDAQLSFDTTQNGYYQGICSYLINLAKLDVALGRD